MKTLVLLLIFYSLQNVVLSINETIKDSSILLKTFPKKVHPIQKFPQKLMNSARVYKGEKAELKKKLEYEEMLKKYTVFPKKGKLDVFNAPDSPLFPLEFNVHQKPRVKKTLRSKRSALNDTGITTAEASTVKLPAKASNPNVVAISRKSADGNKPTVGNKPAIAKRPIKRASNKKKPKARTAVKSRKPLVRKGVGKKSDKKNNKKLLRKSKIAKKGKGRNLRNGTAIVRKVKGVLRDKKRVLKKNPRNSKPSQVRKASRRLIAARDANAEDYPYMASIQKDGEHWCAGALLNRRLIISTANCFWKSTSISRLKVRVGSRQVDHGGQVTRIQEVMKHPHWSIRTGPDNDIALALLDRGVRFSHAVHGVDLPNRVMYPPFEDAWVTSFGSERRDGVYKQHGLTLQMYHVRLMSREKCNNITQRFGIAVSENFICLAQTGRRAPCTRDTGAPAVSDGILWGLASWGIRKLCGTERFPAMFTYVASQTNLDFVINATRVLMSDIRKSPMMDRYPEVYPPAPSTLPEGSD